MLKAIWGEDYDFRTDKIYKRPVCPECQEPFGKFDDKHYRCFACGRFVEVDDPEMIEWLRVREETRTIMGGCVSCGGKDCVEVRQMRNPVTLKWQTMGGKCTKCGMKFMV